jgi:hypothetical protein
MDVHPQLEAIAMNRIRPLAALVGVAALLCAGCWKVQQAAERVKRSNDLKQLVILYHNFHDSQKRGPASADELMPMAADPQEKAVVQAAKDGKYVVIWGVSFGELAKGNVGMTSTVLAYEKEAPTAGGMVAMADGNVINMTATEFESTPKATPKGGK